MQTTQRTKTIVSDLGRVVVDFDRLRTAENYQRTFALKPTAADIDERLNRSETGLNLLERIETGRIGLDAYVAAVAELLGLPPTADRDLFWRCHCDMFSVNAPVVDLWKRVRTTHPDIRLIAFSDCDPLRLQHILDVTGLRFDRLVGSFRVGRWKPHDEMYRAALKAAECAPSDCFYVEDKPENVEAGIAQKMVAHRYDLSDPNRDTLLEAAVNAFLASC
jgi:FMN phosphatase YigB (HAD superfamily)